MKLRKKTLALLLFSVAFMCSVGVSAFVLWQTDALRLQTSQPVSSTAVGQSLYPAADENGKWGYIDEAGNWQIDPLYDEARLFDGKAAWVKQGLLWGAIDATGEFLVQPEYLRIETYADGANRFVAAYDSVLSSQSQNSALYDINGQKLFGLAGELRSPSSGLMAFSRTKGTETRWGYINPHGEIIIEPNYTAVGQAAGNFALVKDENGQTLLLNIYGKTGTEFAAAANLDAVGSRLVLVRDEESGLLGYMDVDGNLQIDYAFAYAEAFRGGAALAAEPMTSGTDNGFVRYGLLNTDGAWSLEPNYREGIYLDNGIYAMALVEEPGYHLVNALGEMLVDGVVYRYDEWQQGLMACHTADNTQFIDRDGNVCRELTLDLAPGAVWQEKLWGVINANGAMWYTAEGEQVLADGCVRQLADGLKLVTKLENTNGSYLAYYPQIENVEENGSLPSQWSKLNTALKAQAAEDYLDEYRDGEEINFTVWGDYTLQEVGDVLTVTQQLELDDSWQQMAGTVERVVHTLCFDKQTGRVYRLADLFVDGFNWRSELLQPLTVSYELQCAGRGEAVLVEVVELLEKRLARNVEFACGADGITLYFALSDGYNVAIELLYTDIDEWLDKDGVMYEALNLGAAQQQTE